MKRWVSVLPVLFTLMAGTLAPAWSSGMAPCGTALSLFGTPSVPAYSNLADPHESCDGWGTYGLQYQCVEYVRRFYFLVKGMETREGKMDRRWNGNASTYFKTASQKGLDAFENGGVVPPQPEDIITFAGGPYGHVAIITAVLLDRVEFIEQNFSLSGTGTLPYNPVTHYVDNRVVSSETFVVEGWLRPHTDLPQSPKGPAEQVANH
jgi:surface antigen